MSLQRALEIAQALAAPHPAGSEYLLLGALLARGLDAFGAACLAAHVHGAAGDRVARERGVEGLVASDLCDAISKELS